MRHSLCAVFVAIALLAGAVAAPRAEASSGPDVPAPQGVPSATLGDPDADGTGAPIALLTGLLAVGFLLAHKAMDDDD